MRPRLGVALIYLFAGLLFSISLFIGVSFFWFASTQSFYTFIVPGSSNSSFLGYFLIFASLFVGVVPISIYLSRFYGKSKVILIGLIAVVILTGIIGVINEKDLNNSEVIETTSVPVNVK